MAPGGEGLHPPPAPSRISIGGGFLIPQLNGFGYHPGAVPHSIGGPERITECNVKLPSTEQVDLDGKVMIFYIYLSSFI